MEIEVLIQHLGVPHRARAAYRTLLSMGEAATSAVQEGLQHENAEVRYYCCRLLDHFLTPETLPALLERLEDTAPNVRLMALHAMACDRCKQGEWRPTEAETLPEALRLLEEDDSAHVRAMAVEVVGLFTHTNPQATHALTQAQAYDVSPTVRKKAGWYAPGGTIYKRTMPRPVRKAPSG